MSKAIDSEKLKELADEVWNMLEKQGVDAESFTLAVRVSSRFYRSIKENFPDRHKIDMIVGSGDENWHINLMCSPFESSADEEIRLG